MYDITPIIEAAGLLFATVITCVLVPYIKSKTTSEQQKEINAWVKIAVSAAEQIFNGSGRGEEKKAYVIAWLKEHGDAQGVTFVMTFNQAFKGILNKNRDVYSTADLAGLKLRVPDSASLIEIGTAMGYVPTPTAAADQYMSLSQGIVDGADHALWAHQTWKLTEIAKHYSDTRHALQCVFFIMNNDSLASLPEEYQKIVLDTFAEVEKELADQTRKDSDESYVKAEADGVKVIPYEEIDIDSFKQALSGIVDEYSNLAPDLYDIISKLAD